MVNLLLLLLHLTPMLDYLGDICWSHFFQKRIDIPAFVTEFPVVLKMEKAVFR